jgi:hypothetical protein
VNRGKFLRRGLVGIVTVLALFVAGCGGGEGGEEEENGEENEKDDGGGGY